MLGVVPAAPAQRPPLAFYGFRAGVPLATADAQVRLLLGPGLTCQRSAADPRLQDCRATMTEPGSNAPLAVWLAAIDSVTAIVTVSTTLPMAQFDRWRDELEWAYGPRPATLQGGQGMVQWIQATQMLRLTWRRAAGRVEASVSLVDGPTFDGWTFSGRPPHVANPRAPD